MNIKKVIVRLNLAGGVALKNSFQVVFGDTVAGVAQADKLFPGVLNVQFNSLRAGVE